MRTSIPLCNGRDAHIEFLGYQSECQLQSLCHNVFALIQPSFCCEVFGPVNLEAFREETPVIVRNIGGMPLFTGSLEMISGAENREICLPRQFRRVFPA
jgi:glycosyltransferase involved in cell wall biosynthesis